MQRWSARSLRDRFVVLTKMRVTFVLRKLVGWDHASLKGGVKRGISLSSALDNYIKTVFRHWRASICVQHARSILAGPSSLLRAPFAPHVNCGVRRLPLYWRPDFWSSSFWLFPRTRYVHTMTYQTYQSWKHAGPLRGFRFAKRTRA